MFIGVEGAVGSGAYRRHPHTRSFRWIARCLLLGAPESWEECHESHSSHSSHSSHHSYFRAHRSEISRTSGATSRSSIHRVAGGSSGRNLSAHSIRTTPPAAR